MKIAKMSANTPRTLLIIYLLSLFAQVASAQTIEPQRDQLLNGLRVLIWTRPGDQTVVLKLRIHGGAIFDTVGKSGTMALLGDLLFPDTATHEYFTAEMGGRLDVETDYDAITVTLQGRASEYDRIVDILRSALVATPLTIENLSKVREARLRKLSESKLSGGEIADFAIASRLLGAFPYAHPIGGTPETLKKVERADVMLARDRFLIPDNATLAIVGGVDSRRAMRALRQLLGGWRKSDQVVPATFRQPDPPDRRTLIINSIGLPVSEVRLATRGLARSDPDYFAASELTVLARERWRKLAEAPTSATFYVRADGHKLPEMFVMGAAVDAAAAARTLEAAKTALRSLITTPASTAELDMVKGISFGLANQTSDSMMTAWLDVDTYGLQPVSEQLRRSTAISALELQRVAGRLFTDNPVASVIVGNEEQLKAEFAADRIQLVSSSTPAKNKVAEPLPPKTTDHYTKTPTPKSEVPVIKNSGSPGKP